MQKILITGSAGFIGASLAKHLLENGRQVIGIDNHNDYYDVQLKSDRVKRIINNDNYTHIKCDILNAEELEKIFTIHAPECVVNLAAQAGVRYSIENPKTYIDTNIVGFANVLEQCRRNKIKHLVYASSSSVYGLNQQLPFDINKSTDYPLSLYAASKKANELMAHSYSNLYNIPTTGLRFFTVYGPWGRPDMALFKFTRAIMEDRPIELFNNGNHKRDFTFIDDVVEILSRVIDSPAKKNNSWGSDELKNGTSTAPWRIYNVGTNNPISLREYVECIEYELNKKAIINYLPLQDGDVPDTHADIEITVNEFGYRPNTDVKHGVEKFVDWFTKYYRA